MSFTTIVPVNKVFRLLWSIKFGFKVESVIGNFIRNVLGTNYIASLNLPNFKVIGGIVRTAIKNVFTWFVDFHGMNSYFPYRIAYTEYAWFCVSSVGKEFLVQSNNGDKLELKMGSLLKIVEKTLSFQIFWNTEIFTWQFRISEGLRKFIIEN